GTHYRRDLRDALGGHLRLIVEDAPKVVAVGKDIGLQREESATGVYKVDARQTVLLGDLLGAQVLFDRHREVGAALDRGVIDDQHTFLSLHHAYTGDDASGGRLAFVHTPSGERVELQEWCLGVAEHLDALAGEQLVTLAVPGDGLCATALTHLLDAHMQLIHQ